MDINQLEQTLRTESLETRRAMTDQGNQISAVRERLASVEATLGQVLAALETRHDPALESRLSDMQDAHRDLLDELRLIRCARATSPAAPKPSSNPFGSLTVKQILAFGTSAGLAMGGLVTAVFKLKGG